ncbi:MAG: tRNA preQ1(34) S-adenosylmethionine ribosyltransferase-isomerase QueA, partial [Verrucomicrobiales bacterium]|nr:tRNA preQ1(34) S-adenosylmethionine ribosyltransferase-isomerase QueA [Verrucomicrobiales bacterium]
MQTSDFEYELPDELIAQRPPERRGESRMMVVDRQSGEISHQRFADFPDFIDADDRLVLNDTRVVAARYFSNDGKKEVLRVDLLGPKRWKCLIRPGKRFKIGHTVEIGESTGTVVEICEEGGERIIEFDREPDEDAHGHLALPPYIDRPDTTDDRERYQTVYAREAGAIAAPTAGLHFSDEMLQSLPHSFVTLHVGIGTFRPVSDDDLTKHHMHSERYDLTPETVANIENANRTVAIGTTVVRVLESCAHDGQLKAGTGETDIFIYPPYQFQVVDALLTNFHLPKSTLLMLVSA